MTLIHSHHVVVVVVGKQNLKSKDPSNKKGSETSNSLMVLHM